MSAKATAAVGMAHATHIPGARLQLVQVALSRALARAFVYETSIMPSPQSVSSDYCVH